jgi:hypothetical protein
MNQANKQPLKPLVSINEPRLTNLTNLMFLEVAQVDESAKFRTVD